MNRSNLHLYLSLLLAAFALSSYSTASAQSAFTQVSYGSSVICAVRDDKTAVCNSAINVEARTPADLQPVEEISASRTAACAVLVSGDLRCWGDQSFGLTTPPTGGAPYKSISISDSHGCVINSANAIDCWGLESNNRLLAPLGEYEQLSVSVQQTCAVSLNGAVICWGANDQGTSDVPVDLPATQKVAAGFASSCALLQDGNIQCWGREMAIPKGGPYVDVYTSATGNPVSGNTIVCGVNADGRVDCGATRYRNGDVLESTPNDAPRGPGVVDISLFGGQSGCYISSDGMIECFGVLGSTEVPSLNSNMLVPDTTGLRAEIYSATTIELLWDSPRDAFNVAGHEVQRNGEVVAITQNSSSYTVDDIVPGVPTIFAVRRVSVDGLSGAFSNIVEVTTGDGSGGSNPGVGGPDYQPPVRAFEPNGLEAQVYGAAAVELFWERENLSSIDGYEIRRNGTYIGFSIGTSFFDEVPSSDRIYRYDVIPVNRTDSSIFYGFSSIDVPFGGSEPGVCL